MTKDQTDMTQSMYPAAAFTSFSDPLTDLYLASPKAYAPYSPIKMQPQQIFTKR